MKRVQAFLVNETYVKVGHFEAWVWVAVEPIHRFVLGVYLSRHQNMIVAQLFLQSLVERYGEARGLLGRRDVVPGGVRSAGSGAPSALAVREEPHGESQPVPEGQVEEFDDYFPCHRGGCDLSHVRHWLGLFVDMHYARRRHVIRFPDLIMFLSGGEAR